MENYNFKITLLLDDEANSELGTSYEERQKNIKQALEETIDCCPYGFEIAELKKEE